MKTATPPLYYSNFRGVPLD